MIKINHAEYQKLFDWFKEQKGVYPNNPFVHSNDTWLKIGDEDVPIWICREGTDNAEDIIEKFKRSLLTRETQSD